MILDISFHRYQEIRAINPSSFKSNKNFLSPLHFKMSMGAPSKETPAMTLGRCIHAAFLEPELFFESEWSDDEIIATKNMIAGLKRDIDDIDVIFSRNENSHYEKSIYLFAEFDNMDFVKFHQVQQKTFEGGIIQNEFTVVPELMGKGFFVKTRPDNFNTRRKDAIDLKTCKCAHPDYFKYDCETYGYHIQAAFTLDMLTAEFGVPYTDYSFACVEKEYPYCATHYICSEDFIEQGRQDYINRLEWIWKCNKQKYWEGYSVYSDAVEYDSEGNVTKRKNRMILDLPTKYYYRKNRISEKADMLKTKPLF